MEKTYMVYFIPDEAGVKKLFLCTHDFVLGDRVYDTFDEFYLDFNNSEGLRLYKEYAKNNLVKIIGEISPDAEWVKDGMELAEEDIRFTYSLPVTIDSPARSRIETAVFGYVPSDEDMEDWSHRYLHSNGGRGTSWEIKDVKVDKILVRCPSAKSCFH